MKKVFWFLFFMALVVTANAQRIPDLNAISATADDDLLYIVDVSDTTGSADGTGKKATVAQITANLVTGINWDDIGGTQSDINVSGFTNDSGYITNTNWDAMPTIQNSAINWDDIDEDVIKAVNWDFYIGGGGLWTEGSSDAIYYNAGNVGIGTSEPSAELEVVGELLISGGTGSLLGIGTTAPSSELEVVGTATMTGFKMVTGASNGYILTSDADGVGTWEESTGGASQWTDEASSAIAYSAGNVGIGTTAPAQQLEITGSLRMPTTTTATTGVIYKGTKSYIHNFSHPTGDSAIPSGRNLFVGEDVGNFTMGETATSTSHSSDNTGIGTNILLVNTTGYGNVAIGSYTLNKNTTGYFNTAIGRGALYENTVAANCVGIGYNALNKNTQGNSNIAIGSQAMLNNTLGFSNIAIGASALNASTLSGYNVAVGDAALYSIIQTQYNVGLGRQAGRYIADGSTANTASAKSIFIGGLSKASADSLENEIVIGYNAIGSGSNSATLGATTITSTFLRGATNIRGTTNNCTITVDADATCDAGTKIGEDNSIALCMVCAAN